MELLEQGFNLNNNDEIKQKLIDEINALKEKILMEQQRKAPEILQNDNEINNFKNSLFQQNRRFGGEIEKKKMGRNRYFEEEEKLNVFDYKN